MNYTLPIRILIADDHRLILDGLQDNFRTSPEFEVVGEARDGETLVKLTRIHVPDVVMTDIRMPVMNGIEATRMILEEYPHIGVIGLSSFEEENILVDMLRAGAKCFLLKTADKSEIFEAVRRASKAEQFYCSGSREKMGEIMAGKNYNPFRETAASLFTERELEVVRLVCEGYSSKQIAEQLGLKRKTVDSYREDIMEKMEVNNAAAFVMYAVNQGLYQPPSR